MVKGLKLLEEWWKGWKKLSSRRNEGIRIGCLKMTLLVVNIENRINFASSVTKRDISPYVAHPSILLNYIKKGMWIRIPKNI
jgi:hypothetical protein